MSGLLKRIIPCFDVSHGRVVKGVNFVNLRDMGDPIELAIAYENQGADEIVFLDITATTEERDAALNNVKEVASTLSIPFSVGGGLRTLTDAYDFLNAGADKVALNSAAIANPILVNDIAQQFGSQCVVVAIDIKPDGNFESGYQVYASGGNKATGLDAKNWARQIANHGAGEILLTSMHRDGTGEGFDNRITGELANELTIPVIASGGAKSSQDLLDAFNAGADAVLAATMFHSGEFKINDVKQFLSINNIPVRLSC